ncbi:MAG TPA: FmdB family zinc ribbon protein [Acidimicrobiales bacterium]|nr:FmdB family zinc ribbon protein [Acidimicrobiales bacterium]
MPTYEYVCKQCGEHVEVVQSFRDEPLATCANCGGPLRKVFGSIGITFKGSGFYRTDSRPAARSEPAAKSESAAKSDSAAKGDGSKAPSSGGSSAKDSKPSRPSSSSGSRAEAG